MTHLKALAIACLLCIGAAAHAEEESYQVDNATVDAIRAAAAQMANAAASVRVAMEESGEQRSVPAQRGN